MDDDPAAVMAAPSLPPQLQDAQLFEQQEFQDQPTLEEAPAPPLSMHNPDLLPPPSPAAAAGAELPPPSPMDHLAASAASMQSMGSIGEDIDVNSQGLVEETLERLSRVRGVLGVLILDGSGAVIRTTMDERAVAKYASPVQQLLQRAHGVVGLTKGDRLQMLCVRTSKHEMLLCSERNQAYSILVIQNPNADINVASMVAGM